MSQGRDDEGTTDTMDYRVEYQGEVTIVGIGHASKPILVNGEATMYRVSDGNAKVDTCIRLAMRALYACQIVECEEDATSTDCVVWDEVEYEPVRRADIRVIGYWRRGEPARYAVRSTRSGTVVWDGEATSPDAALDAMARDAGYRDFATACAVSRDEGSHLVVVAS